MGIVVFVCMLVVLISRDRASSVAIVMLISRLKGY